MAYKAVKSNVVSCPTFGQNSGRVKATRCCTVAIASVFLLIFRLAFPRDNGAYEYGTTQMWPGTIIIQDTLFSFHFYYYGLWFWGSTIDRQVQPFNQTLQPQLTAIVVEYEYEYLMVYPETTPLPMETISLHSNSVLSGLLGQYILTATSCSHDFFTHTRGGIYKSRCIYLYVCSRRPP